MSTFDLFVYGTLRSDGAAAGHLSGCSFVGEASLRGVLYDVDGRFPALLRYGDGVVHGEIWRCPAHHLLVLDRYEGTADGLFRRIGDEARLTSGEPVPCWVYAAGPALARKLTPDRRIAGGRWPSAG